MRENIHTVYDRMAAKGYFSSNPANPDARDPITGEAIFKAQEYPRMVYHPEGKKKVLTPAVTVPGPGGPTVVPATYEIINKIAKDEKEFKELLKAGWWEHPSDAFWASLSDEEKENTIQPAKSSVDRVAQLEKQLAEMQKELSAAKSGPLQDDSTDDEAA